MLVANALSHLDEMRDESALSIDTAALATPSRRDADIFAEWGGWPAAAVPPQAVRRADRSTSPDRPD